MSANEPDWVGKTNPSFNEPEEHVECDACEALIYGDESYTMEDGNIICMDCLANAIEDLLIFGQYNVSYNGDNSFVVTKK